MTETVKKTTTRKPKAETTAKLKVEAAAKPKVETAAKTPKAPAKANGKANGKLSNLTVMPPSHEQIAALAHRYWAERGYQHGLDADDWLRAEQELRGKAS